MPLESAIEVNYSTLIIALIAILLGALAIFLFIKNKYENRFKNLQEEAVSKLRVYENKISLLNNSNKNTIETYELKLTNLNEKLESREKQLLREFKIKEENLNEKITLLEESKIQLKIEFENLANKIFEDNQKKSNLNLNQVLTSFKDQLNAFGKRVDDIYNEETKQRTSLLVEIKNLKELNNQISSDAINLTKALKGQNKTQGDWGEMILSSILEQSGLREGKEYTVSRLF